MKQVFLVGSVLAIVITATCTIANAELPYSPEAWALQKTLFSKDIETAKGRGSLATALRTYCESVLVQVPSNTPEEDRWVDNEYKELQLSVGASGWEQRMERVNSSPENARKSLRHIFYECSSLANKIDGSETKPATDALIWAQLSRLFSAEEEVWRFADIVGLVSRKYCSSLRPLRLTDAPPVGEDKNNLCIWNTVQQVILDHAVVPLLAAGAQ